MLLTLRSCLVAAMTSITLFAPKAEAEPVKRVVDVREPWAKPGIEKTWRADPIDPWAKPQRAAAITRREVIDPWRDTQPGAITRADDVVDPW